MNTQDNVGSRHPDNEIQAVGLPAANNQGRKLKQKAKYVTRVIVGTAIYYVLSGAILWGCLQIPDIDTKQKWLADIYYRYTYFSSYFSMSKLVYFWLMMLIGPTYVNIVTLENVRKNPILDAHMSPRSYYKTALIVAPLVFLFSAVVCLRGRYDLNMYCDEETGEGCQIYTKRQVFYYDWLIWTSAYYLGLNFTHADQGIMQKFVLDWNVMKTWPAILWVVFFVLMAFLGALAVIIVKVYYSIGIWIYYIIWAILVALYFYYRGRGAVDTHIHHYVVSAIAVSFICYQNIFLTFVHGMFCGILIEGGTRWGYDPIWVYRVEEPDFTDLRNEQTKYEQTQFDGGQIEENSSSDDSDDAYYDCCLV